MTVELSGTMLRLGDVMRRYAQVRNLTARQTVLRHGAKFQNALRARMMKRAPAADRIRREAKGRSIRIRKLVRDRVSDRFGARMHDLKGNVFGVKRTKSGRLKVVKTMGFRDRETKKTKRLGFAQALREAELRARIKSAKFMTAGLRLGVKNLDRAAGIVIDRRGRSGQRLSTAQLQDFPDGPELALQLGGPNTDYGEALLSRHLAPEVETALQETIEDTLEYVARKEEEAFDRALNEAFRN